MSHINGTIYCIIQIVYIKQGTCSVHSLVINTTIPTPQYQDSSIYTAVHTLLLIYIQLKPRHITIIYRLRMLLLGFEVPLWMILTGSFAVLVYL